MREVYIKIMDKSGTTFSLDISTPGMGTKIWHAITEDFTGQEPVMGTWKALEKGFLRYNFGRTRSRISNNGDLTTRDLLILSVDGVGIGTYDRKSEVFGMQLFQYEDWNGVNAEGEGIVVQPWVLNIAPGRIKWEMLGLQYLQSPGK